MGIQYSGGPYVNYTFTDAGTRADLVSKLNTQLKNAGMSVISGDGTGDVLMKTAVTPAGLSVRFRLYDPGSGNCAQVSMKNNAGTLTSQIYYLLPASVNWRIVANPYWFLMFQQGAANRAAARRILYGGTIYVPSDVLTVMGADLDCGFIEGSGGTDTDTTAYSIWRANIQDPGGSRRSSVLWRSFMLNGGGNAGSPLINAFNSGNISTLSMPQVFEGGAYLAQEPYVAWSPDAGVNSRAKHKGQLWDAAIFSSPMDGEVALTFDTHGFISITDQFTMQTTGYGTLIVATS